MSNIVIFGATQSGKTTLLGYLATAMLRHPQLNEEIYKNFKLIRKLTTHDEFSIGDPSNPVKVNKEIILPSFVSLDKDELRKFREHSTEGSSKRIHHQNLTVCISQRNDAFKYQNENENISCTFLDLPGFRQKLSDKYRGFFEGDVGIAVIKLQNLLELHRLLENTFEEDKSKIDELERRLFEPIRIWCDYRSPKGLMIVLSQIDLSLIGDSDKQKANNQIADIKTAINLIKQYTEQFTHGNSIPISPISIQMTSEENTKKHFRMSIFFKRKEDNIYLVHKELPGDGSFISCLKKILPIESNSNNKPFSMASVYRPIKAIVNASPKTALNIHAIHGTIRNTDILTLGPVKNNNNQIVFAQCEISSIKADGSKTISDKLLEGNAGGLVFKSLKLQDKYRCSLSYDPKESDLFILKSTILYKNEIIKGDIIELEIPKKYHITMDNHLDKIYSIILPSLMPFDELVVFWYGKKVMVNVTEINFLNDKLLLSVIVSQHQRHLVKQFALPSIEGEIKYKDNALIAVPRSYYTTRPKNEVQGMYTYISSNIVGIKDSADFNYLQIDSQNNFEINKSFDGIHQVDKSNEENNIYSIPFTSTEKWKDIYILLKQIGRNTRDWIDRVGYRQLGLKVRLLKK